MSHDDWKQRYLDQLDTHERQEQHWRDEKHSLQRLLVRASLAAEGQDRGLDEVLGQLRDAARAEEPDMALLRGLQNRLDELVTGFDENRNQAVVELRGALEQLVRQLSDHADRPQRKALNRFLKQADTRVVHYTALPEVLNELATLQARVLEAAGDEKASGGLWSRLWGKTETEPKASGSDPDQPASHDAGEAAVVSDGSVVAEPTDQELELDGGQSSDDAVAHVGERLAVLVRQLQTQFNLPERVDQRAEDLQERARESVQWNQVRGILDEVAQLVVAAVGRGQREFESFLSGLDDRLTGIKSQFSSGALDLGSWQSLSQHYDEQLHREIEAMDRETTESGELEAVQQAVHAHVQRLNATLDEYREAGDERERQLREEVVGLQEKVTALEERSREVQTELQRERQRATTDMLTQLPNREALEERLQQEYERWERYQQPVSMAILDIDRFKELNDTYGHLAGDKVLQLLARSLRENLRQPDFIARYGGEEFVILFPETDPEAANGVMEKLRRHISKLPFHFRQERVEVTFSAGIVGFEKGLDTFSLLDVADRAMYRAKSSGRNRSCLAQAEDYRPKGHPKQS